MFNAPNRLPVDAQGVGIDTAHAAGEHPGRVGAPALFRGQVGDQHDLAAVQGLQARPAEVAAVVLDLVEQEFVRLRGNHRQHPATQAKGDPGHRCSRSDPRRRGSQYVQGIVDVGAGHEHGGQLVQVTRRQAVKLCRDGLFGRAHVTFLEGGRPSPGMGGGVAYGGTLVVGV
jgi:hypothetical protein